MLATTAPLLTSALSDLPCEQATVDFGPGDSILFYTDGVTEASGPPGMFGQDRLISILMRGDRQGADLLDEILRDVATFTGSSSHQDDVTLLTLDVAAEQPA
jgi:sigma-B regulation protein RsbU (phosphoserine phosphatase)